MKSPCWDDLDYPVTQPWLPGPPAVHCGIDIGCPGGTIIKAARAGIVETVATGIVGIHVNDSTQRDFYLHGYSLVVVGQHVDAGTPVIHSDTVQVDPRYPLTGPHLHFEVEDGYTLPAAPPFAPEHSLDPVPILLGVATLGEQPWTVQGEAQGYITDTRLTQADFLGIASGNVAPIKVADLMAAIKAIQATDNSAVLAAIAALQADVTAIKARTDKDLAP